MAEPSSIPPQAPRGGGLELRLERDTAHVALSAEALLPGSARVTLSMEVPGARPPFDLAAGAGQFKTRLCDLERLEVELSGEALAALPASLDLAGAGLARLALAARAGFVEGAGALADGTPFSFRAALLAADAGPGVTVLVHEPRLYAPSAVPAALLPALVARAARPVAAGGEAPPAVDPLPALLRRVLPPHGFKLPRTAAVRLARVEVEPGRLRLAWDRAAAAAAPSDPDLLAALDGARAFAEGERALWRGDVAGALAAYRAQGHAAAAHPFATARLVALLAAAPPLHGEALSAATSALARRPESVAALLATAQVRAARGEPAAASRALAAAAELAARRGEESGALLAAEAALALGAAGDPAAQAAAAETALRVRRDHLPALRALVALGERAGDRDALLRAGRRLAAYAPDPDEKAAAHARLGTLLAGDLPAARLHLDHALRLARGAATLRAVTAACDELGEHVRAVHALDRLRDEALATGDGASAAEAEDEAARRWEAAGQAENAALRRERAARLRAEREGRPPPPDPVAAARGEGRGGPDAAPDAPDDAAAREGELARALACARAAPLDPAALRALAREAASAAPWTDEPHRRRLALLSRTAAALEAFASGAASPDEATPPHALSLPPELRAAALHSASRGALPRLLALLAPALEPLYQADLGRHGVGPADALGPDRAPHLAALLLAARDALGARACDGYLRGGDDLEVHLENTRPAALVLGGGVERAGEPVGRFLIARGVALVDLGWAIAGRLGPDARAILCELACRFAGAAPPSPVLPAAQAEALLSALRATVPPATHAAAAALGAAAAAELATSPQPRLAAAARRSASRLALLHAGAPAAALGALVASERALRQRPRPEALAHGDVRDLAAFALSDSYLAFRAEAP